MLSIIHPHLYFPTWSNSLKEIGNFLEFEWSKSNANGLQSIVWRENWERTQDPVIKEQLIQYNRDDCLALKRVTDFIESALVKENNIQSIKDEKKVCFTKEIKTPTYTKHSFGKKDFVLTELDIINKCAYFDYQRDKVYIRTNKNFRKINHRFKKQKNTPLKPNKVIEIHAKKCKSCQSKKISPQKEIRKQEIDLKFFKGGVKKWVIEYISWKYKCNKCQIEFIPDNVPDQRKKHGHGLMSWCVYHNIIAGQNILKIRRSLADVFDLHISRPAIYRFKSYIANHLKPLEEQIIKNIIKGEILHVDETEINLRNHKGYVWVFTNLENVYFVYRESREADFLKDLLRDFKGVLISDFFSGYDSLSCPQQKCLIHLIRDMNEDLLSNPFDEELKSLTQKFAYLLREIVSTIDKYGLKKRHLTKHKKSVNTFIKYVTTKKFSSEVSKKYQKRIKKYQDRLFTFIKYDGVPWNNNNAEHAIKSFAKYRRFADGRPTEKSIRDFLIILSVLQTCEYRNIDILKFLLSKKYDLV